MDELPKCQFCDALARYDDKTKMGPWAYMCERHHKVYGVGVGYKLEKRVKIAAEKTDKVPLVSVPLTLDSIAEVRCPHCGETHSVEPDANYIKECESCGNKFKLVSPI